MNAYLKYDRIECRLGTYVATLQIAQRNCTRGPVFRTVDSAAARRIVVAWKRPEFKGASFYAVPLSGTTPLAVSLNEVCAMFEVKESSRKGADARVVVPVTAVAKPTPKAKRAKIVPPPVKVEAPVAPVGPVVYTLGYDHGVTPSQMLAMMAERGVKNVVDTRANLSGRAPGWKSTELASLLKADYHTAQNMADVCHLVGTVGSCILIRKEEAPGDNDFHLAIAKTLATFGVTVLHLFRAETVEGAELQRAIDQDNDYDCDIAEVPASAGMAVA